MGDEQMLYVRSTKDFNNDSSSSNDEVWDDSVLVEAYDHAVNLAKSEVEKRMNGSLYEQNAGSSDCSLPNVGSMDPSTVRQSGASKKTMKKKREVCPLQWSEGDPCRCVYSVDGKVYEAYIIKISHGGSCTVKYVGYDNEEETYLSVLSASHGDAARTKQANTAMQDIALNGEENLTVNAADNVVEPPATKRRGKKPSRAQPSNQMDWEQFEHAPSQTSNYQGRRSQQSPHLRQQFSMAMPQMPQMAMPPPPPLNVLAAAGCPSDESEALSAMLMSWYMSGFHTGYYQGMKTGKEQATSPAPKNPPRKR